jgi:CheY-like chemotaxis protein
MRQPVRVVLADDHDAFVEGLGMVLSAEGDLEIVALAGDGASALQAVLTHRPDVLVVDTQMPGPAVTELVRLVGQAEPATRVLLLAEDARLEPSSQAGPAGMTRAVSARELAQAIRAVAAGFRVVAADPPAPQGSPKPHGSPKPRDSGAPNGRVADSRKGRAPLSTAPGRPLPTAPSGPSATTTPSCCCAACPSASARSWTCWPAATPTDASPRPASCRSTPSAPTCRTCWSSWACTPSWRRPRWPCAGG